MTVEAMPKDYAGLTRDQAIAQVFFKRIRMADGLGMPLADQRRAHEDFQAATTYEEKQKVVQRVFEWSLKANK